MKNFKILILGLLVLQSSCSDFLDKKPLVQTSVQTYYSTDEEVNSALMGIYSRLQRENFQLGPMLIIGDDCSDDADIGNENSEAFSWLGPVSQSLQKFDHLSTNWLSSALWGEAFTGISWTNQAIESILANRNLLSEKSDLYLGEAYFLRAFFYFFLTRQYGRMPIVDHVLSYNEFYSPRASIEETWDFIVRDLKKAIELLPKKSEYSASDLGRGSEGGGYGRVLV